MLCPVCHTLCVSPSSVVFKVPPRTVPGSHMRMRSARYGLYAVTLYFIFKLRGFTKPNNSRPQKAVRFYTCGSFCFNYTLVVIPYGFTPYTLYPRRIHYTLVVIPYSVHYPLTPTRPQTFQRNLTRRTGPHTATRGRNVPPPAQRLNRPPCRPAPTTATGTCPSG